MRTILLLLCASCAAAPRPIASPATPPSSIEASAEKSKSELLTVDRAFSARAAEIGVDAAFAEYADDDAVMLPMGAAPIVSKKAIVASFQPGGPKVQLRWEPRASDASGDLGYTWGTFVSVVDKAGEKIERSGKYVTVWKRRASGWRWVVDIGNLGPS